MKPITNRCNLVNAAYAIVTNCGVVLETIDARNSTKRPAPHREGRA